MRQPEIPTQRPGRLVEAAGERYTDPRWRSWYEECAPVVYGYVRFHVDSPDEAEDLTAEVFVKAFRSSHRFDGARGSVRTWLLAVARNTIRDHRRRSRRRKIPLTSLRDLESEAPSPEERLLWEEQVRKTLEAVSALGARDREIISLRYGSGLGIPAIADILGLSESAVTTRLWRALKRLRRKIEA